LVSDEEHGRIRVTAHRDEAPSDRRRLALSKGRIEHNTSVRGQLDGALYSFRFVAEDDDDLVHARVRDRVDDVL
jgi:hypothetical protein